MKKDKDVKSENGQKIFKKKSKKGKGFKSEKNKRFKKWKRTNDLKSEKGRKIWNGNDELTHSIWRGLILTTVFEFEAFKRKKQFLALLIERIKFWRQKLVWAQELHSQERICKLFFETSFSENSSSNSFQTRNWLLTISDSKVCSLQKRSDNWNVWFVLLKNISLYKSRRRIFH